MIDLNNIVNTSKTLDPPQHSMSHPKLASSKVRPIRSSAIRSVMIDQGTLNELQIMQGHHQHMKEQTKRNPYQYLVWRNIVEGM